MNKHLLILLLSVFTLNLPLNAREIHVAVNGNDKNDGSVLNPFRTINHAAQLAMPGDIITVHGGVYREQIIPPRGGISENERITYRAAKGEKVEIKGSEIIKGWQKLDNDCWVVKIPNSFFGNFNPYKDIIRGDWFWPTPKERIYHTGAVYLNGDWLMEAQKKEEVTAKTDEKNPLWWTETDSATTTIWAQFRNTDPNQQTVEINVRQTVFYPDKPFINFISISGFILQHAATNWAPPTAEQKGLIGTNWSRGWIIENNIVQYSKCVGIALGKHGDAYDNKDSESALGYVGTINRALAFGWNKGTVGGHIVRNNTVAYCEQAGIVGSMGCAFSIISGNTIHDIHVRRLFTGAEMAGIKFHGAVDVQINNNHIYNVNMGIWLDWMAQGAQLNNNLMHDNLLDIFLEVDHGPMLISNNILLSPISLLMNSSGAAFAHNLFGGRTDVISYDSRLTPLHLPHSTFIKAMHDNPSGDVRFYNNIFADKGDVSQYSKALLPVLFDGNLFTKGSKRPQADSMENKFGELSESGKEKFKNASQETAVERNSVIKQDFDTDIKLIIDSVAVYLEINFYKDWVLQQQRKIVNSTIMGKAVIPDLPFENADGTQIKIITDYFGKLRYMNYPSPGPFEIIKSGRQKIKVW
ncbi:MAG: right-handed parallel beta-helix repeat-containing protein [Bacteroidetes bacterium]|nr:right-handed parallel beta-helix repeat-containing protein [Bacteroidota bacterium]